MVFPQLFDRFWWNLAHWRTLAPYSIPTIKTSNFWKFKMVAAAILKITKIAICHHRFDQSSWNLAQLSLLHKYLQHLHYIFSAFSALMLLVGRQEGHLACKNWVVGCRLGCLSGLRCRLASEATATWRFTNFVLYCIVYGPADATATHCLLLQ